MSDCTIIGVGSPFGDDSVGWDALAYLRRERIDQRTSVVAYQYADRPGSDLLRLMDGYGRAIIIDAARGDEQPGSIYRFTPEELDVHSKLLSSHGFGVGQSLALGRALDALPPRVVVYGIEIGQQQPLGSGDRAMAFAALAHQIERELTVSLPAESASA